MEIPELIDGIKTAKNAANQRREIIRNEYLHLLERLQRERKKKAIFNDYLSVDVYVTMHESGKKASYTSAFNWQSTYAVKHLKQIIQHAKPQEGETIYYPPKVNGKQKEFNYVNMAKLYYRFSNETLDYMNFTVKLTLGIKSDGRHIQYSVNKIDITK
jgi:hypothetical protein